MKKIIRGFVALFLLGTCMPCWSLTLSDIRVQVRRLLNDKPDPKVRFTDLELSSYVNETQREVVNLTWCLNNRTVQTLSVNATYYTLPTDLIAVTYVDFLDTTGRARQLMEVSEKAKRQESPDYERITGPPMEYFVRSSTSSSVLTEQIAILPVPTTSSALGTVRIDYISQATTLTDSVDIPFDGIRTLYPYHYVLVYGTVAKMKMAKGDPTAAADMQLYQAYVTMMKDRLGQMPNYSPGFSASTSGK